MLKRYMRGKWDLCFLLILIGFVLTVPVITPQGVSAQSKEIIMKVGYPMGATPAHPHYLVGNHLKKRVEELTNGRVKVQLYPQSQLGGDRETIEGAMNGTIEMSWPASAPIALAVPEIASLDLPYIFKDEKHAFRALEGRVGKQLEAKLLAKGIRVGGWGHANFRNTLTVKKPINKLEDLQGVKIRVMEAPIFLEMYKAWGAKPTPVAWPEVYMALSQGVVEGEDVGVNAALDMKHFEIVRYIGLTYTSFTLRPIIISEKWWQTLSSDIQSAILKASRETAILMRQKLNEFEEQCIAAAKEKHKVIVTQPDLKPFREAVQAIYPKLEKVVGGREIIDAILSVQ